MNTENGSLEETPTWAISIVCLVLILLSLLIEGALHLLTEFLKRTKRKSLNRALQKIKTELIILGFVSLLLTITEVQISKICVTKALANSFLPCEVEVEVEEQEYSSVVPQQEAELTSKPLAATQSIEESSCAAKGMVSLMSREGVRQLQIFIFTLAVFHVLYGVLIMSLGIAKMRKWKTWEEETKTLDYQIANDPKRFRFTRQTSFGRRHLKCWSQYPLLLWPVCFFRQFSGSIAKADYFTLRNGFIMAHFAEGSDFNFQKFLSRAFDDDFEHVVGISLWIWIFSVLFIFFHAHGFYDYFWLPFIPLMMVLVVGTKLEVIITKMCLESQNKSPVVQGTLLVKPNNDLFWFGRPQWLLHLIHFILFQNSFQLAFFTWAWYEYGLRSCFHREIESIAIQITMGLIVQFLCGYMILPLYALVTQMGSGMKEAIFTARIAKGLKQWHNLARQNLSKSRSISPRHSSETRLTETIETSVSDLQELDIAERVAKGLRQWHNLARWNLSRKKSTSTRHPLDTWTTDAKYSFRDLKELDNREDGQFPSCPVMNTCSSLETTEEKEKQHHIDHAVEISSAPEIIEEATQEKLIRRGNYGEISFAASWKDLMSTKGHTEITSVHDGASPIAVMSCPNPEITKRECSTTILP
ncbi:MLO-like protein 12 [Telopea speciosissima]|uniref:MLO-like protein 12 n=1 Tax=Telopea speciosissima TaxID=54955 RepID=UPI001CC6BF9C|nr:MLO-like protein 12 [Telopea speciosissima]